MQPQRNAKDTTLFPDSDTRPMLKFRYTIAHPFVTKDSNGTDALVWIFIRHPDRMVQISSTNPAQQSPQGSGHSLSSHLHVTLYMGDGLRPSPQHGRRDEQARKCGPAKHHGRAGGVSTRNVSTSTCFGPRVPVGEANPQLTLRFRYPKLLSGANRHTTVGLFADFSETFRRHDGYSR